MKKLMFLLIAMIGLTTQAQMQSQSQVVEKVIVDSIKYNQDSVARVYFKVIRTYRDTTQQMNSTLGEIQKSLKISEDRVKFTDQTVRKQIQYVKDSVSDQDTQQYILQQIYGQNQNLVSFKNETNMLTAIRKKLKEVVKK